MRASAVFILSLAASLTTVADHSAAQPREKPGAVYATFERSGSNTQLLGLAVGDLYPGAKVTINCSGTSCEFSTKTINISSNVKMLAVTDMFLDPILKPGTILEIRVTQPRATGRVFQYETRTSADPKITQQCLPPGSSTAVAC
jgi:hypothetical protein